MIHADDDSRLPLGPLPPPPIIRIVGPLARFLQIEAASGGLLLVVTVIALLLANSAMSEAFLHFWETEIALTIGSFEVAHSIHHWINDGLMAIFFFVVGLEVKRELVLGELRDPRRAMLPIAAALGGMVVPAGIYLYLQWGEPTAGAWGVPMATDIAFVVGCMAVLGRRVPPGLRIMLLTLAIADDIGAILVIAFGYSTGISWIALAAGFGLMGVVTLLQAAGVRSVGVYAFIGFGVWMAFMASGVHATIAGVLLGLLTPARSWLDHDFIRDAMDRAKELLSGEHDPTVHHEHHERFKTLRQMEWSAREGISPLDRLVHLLHPWVSFAIMPLFAFANAGVVVQGEAATSDLAIAIAAGLLLGKPIGVVLASWLAVRTGVARLPAGVGWAMVAGAGCLAGIGFTMALFIASLALGPADLDAAKLGILIGSAISAVLGMAVLLLAPQKTGSASD